MEELSGEIEVHKKKKRNNEREKEKDQLLCSFDLTNIFYIGTLFKVHCSILFRVQFS
jgi:hypothetical protein